MKRKMILLPQIEVEAASKKGAIKQLAVILKKAGYVIEPRGPVLLERVWQDHDMVFRKGASK